MKIDVKELTEKMKQNIELNRQINKLTDKWIEIMANLKAYNESYHTFTLSHISKESYGWSARIESPYSLSLDDLEKYTPPIEYGLKAHFLFKIPDHKKFAMCKIVYPDLVKCNETPFKPYRVKPYELYVGVNVAGEPIKFNINHTPHCLLAGQTSKGKNGSLDHMLTSLIYFNSERDIELYLFQAAKNDLIKYKNCKQVKAFVLGNLEEMVQVLEVVIGELEKRTTLLTEMVENLKGDNLFDFNKLYYSKRLPYIYVVIDEFIEIMPSNIDDKETKFMKNLILNYLRKIAQWGGAYGVTYVIAHQKPEKELCPTFLKNQSLIRICYGFDDPVCSQIVLGNDMAVGLPARRAIYKSDGGFDLLYTTNLRNEDNSSRIKEFIKSSEKPHRTVLDNIKKSKSEKETFEKTKKETGGKVSFDKVDNFNDVDIQNNIAKIPNFVPYNPSKGKVIDETDIAFRKGGKARKC